MSCGCNGTILQGEQFCQDCMPDEFSWLIRVDTQPDPFLMDSSHAYITPDNTVFVLDHTRSKAVPISGGGGGIDLSPYALKTELESKVKDLLAEIQGVNSKIKAYKAGRYIEITSDNTINNTYDDTALSERITELELRDIPVYLAGQGITIRPDKTIDAEVTLDKVNEVVTRAVTDTEINLNSSHLEVEDNNLVWKGTLNTGRQITSTVPLSSLNVNQSAIDELKQRLTAVEGKADNDTTYTAGNGIVLAGTTFSADTNVLATKTSVDALVNRLTVQESKVDKDTKYIAGEGLLLEGTTFKVDGTKVASKTSLDNVINRLLVQEAKRDSNTTYTIRKENSNIVLRGSDGSRSVVVDSVGATVDLTPINNRLTVLENKQDKDTNTTYRLTKEGSNVVLVGSDGSRTSVVDSDTIKTPNIISRTFERVTDKTFTYEGGRYSVPLSSVPNGETVVREEFKVNLGAGRTTGYNVVTKHADDRTFSAGVYSVTYSNTKYEGVFEIYFIHTGIKIVMNTRFNPIGGKLSVLPTDGCIIFGYLTGKEVIEPVDLFSSSNINMSKVIDGITYNLTLTSPITFSLKTTTIKLA